MPGFLTLILVIIFWSSFVSQLFFKKLRLESLLGLIALVTFFYFQLLGSDYAIYATLFFFAGVILIVLEFFVPGGILGLGGFLAIVNSFFILIENRYLAWAVVCVSFLTTILVYILQSKVFKRKFSLHKHFVLSESLSTAETFSLQETNKILLGKNGVSVTALRPAGKIKIDDKQFDAVTSGEFINAHSSIKVTDVDGLRIVVQSLEEV